MKIKSLFTAGLMAGAAVAHSHQKHQHFHEKKRSAEVVGGTHLITDTHTVVMYSYNGEVMDEGKLCEGLENGSVKWVGEDPPKPNCGKKPVPAVSSAPAPSPSIAKAPANAGIYHEEPIPSSAGSSPAESYSAAPVPSSSSYSSSSSPSSPSSPSNPSSSSVSSGSPGSSGSSDSGFGSGYDLDNPNTDKDFPDGQIDCSTFPSEYGAVAVPWVGFEGWSGIQYANIAGSVVSHLATGITHQDGCSTGSGGADTFCSYACPAGFQKSQWPQEQGGADYQISVGGLKCGSDNKLHLTNPNLSKKLCTRGTDSITITNKLGKEAAVCRTDYPGTEAETVPLLTKPGAEVPLTCPESATYYTHQGNPTTAEYYVNDAGVSVEQACQWGQDDSSSGQSYGNWAPLVIGAGMDNNGATWLSIQSSCQNNPEKCNNLSYSIELDGDFGGNNGCYYTQSGGVGYWCSQGKLEDFKVGSSTCQTKASAEVPGCTVQLMSGKATYNFVLTKN